MDIANVEQFKTANLLLLSGNLVQRDTIQYTLQSCLSLKTYTYVYKIYGKVLQKQFAVLM